MTVETKKISLDAIKIDQRTQVRNGLDKERVEIYAQNMKDGEKFPPIDVFVIDGEYVLASGFHRVDAAKQNGYASIEAKVHQGNIDDAILFSLGANARHGLPMTPEEVKSGVRKMLLHPVAGEWSLAHIAKHINTSPMTVSRVRAALKDEGVQLNTKKKYIKDGVIRTIETKNSATKKAAQPPEDNPIEDHIKELSHTVSSLEDENRRLRDAVAVGSWEASEIEKEDVEQLIAELREQIRVLEIDNAALRESRDTYQNQNAELMKTVKSLQAKIKKLENGA